MSRADLPPLTPNPSPAHGRGEHRESLRDLNGTEIVGVLLAAGKGRRFGADKLLHPLADGTPMAIAAARNLRAACDHSLAVLRPDQRQLAGLLSAEGLSIAYSAEAEFGMGHSLAAGVLASPDAGGWIIALADMPFLRPETIVAVVNALRAGASVAAPVMDARRGHPVGFSPSCFDELVGLTGDQGARSLLARQPDRLTGMDCDDPGIFRDVDTPEDLQTHR